MHASLGCARRAGVWGCYRPFPLHRPRLRVEVPPLGEGLPDQDRVSVEPAQGDAPPSCLIAAPPAPDPRARVLPLISHPGGSQPLALAWPQLRWTCVRNEVTGGGTDRRGAAFRTHTSGGARATSQPLGASSSFTSSAPSPPATPQAKPPSYPQPLGPPSAPAGQRGRHGAGSGQLRGDSGFAGTGAVSRRPPQVTHGWLCRRLLASLVSPRGPSAQLHSGPFAHDQAPGPFSSASSHLAPRSVPHVPGACPSPRTCPGRCLGVGAPGDREATPFPG